MSERKPIGLTEDDMRFVRRILIGVVTGETPDLNEEDASHAARLIHRMGRLGPEDPNG